MPNITPFLWFDDQAEEAANHYLSIFPSSRILAVTRYGAGGPGPAGSVMTVDFELDGKRFTALNGGPHHRFTEAVSFSVECDTQEQIDHYWERLSAGGSEQPCGWLKDRFGLSWQIVPRAMGALVGGPDAKKSKRAMEAMLKMSRLDMAALQRAYDGKAA